MMIDDDFVTVLRYKEIFKWVLSTQRNLKIEPPAMLGDFLKSRKATISVVISVINQLNAQILVL